MAILSKSGFYDAIESVKATGRKVYNRLGALVPEFASTFVSGFAGRGWAIRNTARNGDAENWEAEFDSLTIRKGMTVHELLISKIRAVNGGLLISHANGKIKSVEKKTLWWEIRLEDDNRENCEWVAGDWMRMQIFANNNQRYFCGYINSIVDKTDDDGSYYVLRVMIPASHSVPQAGDEVVQFGHNNNTARQSAIYIRANAGGGRPAIDMLDGIKHTLSPAPSSTIDNNWVMMRIGGDLPDKDSVESNGFYCKNGTIFSENDQRTKVYELRPNGSGQLAKGAIQWTENGDITLNNNVQITWGNLTEDTKDNLRDGVAPKVQYSADNVTWRDNYQQGDEWMRIGYEDDPTSWSVMKLDQSGDNAYLHIRYGYYQQVGQHIDDGSPIMQLVMLPINPTDAQMEQATHIGVRTDASPNYPTPDLANQYTWSKFRGEDGKDGQDANLLEWVQDWNSRTQLDSNKIVSPKIFSGKNDSGMLTGVAMGDNIIAYSWANGKPIYDGVGQTSVALTGIAGIANDNIKFLLDPERDVYYFDGDIHSENAFIRGEVHAERGDFTGTVTATSGNIGGYVISPNGLSKEYYDEDQPTHKCEMDIYSTGIGFRESNENNTNVREVRLGTNVSNNTNFRSMLVLRDTDTQSPHSKNPKSTIIVETNGTQFTPTNGEIGNCAIDMRGGYLRGHCASLQVVSDSTTINRGINVVVITGNKNVTITPPSTMSAKDDGYLLRVVNDGTGTMNVGGITYDGTRDVQLIWSHNLHKWIKI